MTEGIMDNLGLQLDPEYVTAMVCYLGSEQCELTHEIFSVGAGRYARVFVGLCPGWTDTDLVDFEAIARRSGVSPEQSRASAEAENAQRRIVSPEELGPMCVLLASHGGGAITGQVIGVDGGYRL
jgi:hypothetical protein